MQGGGAERRRLPLFVPLLFDEECDAESSAANLTDDLVATHLGNHTIATPPPTYIAKAHAPIVVGGQHWRLRVYKVYVCVGLRDGMLGSGVVGGSERSVADQSVPCVPAHQ